MAFNSRVYATAAFVCFAMLAPCAQAKDIQMLPPVGEGSTTACPEGSSRVLTWDGGTAIACATGVTASGGNVAAQPAIHGGGDPVATALPPDQGSEREKQRHGEDIGDRLVERTALPLEGVLLEWKLLFAVAQFDQHGHLAFAEGAQIECFLTRLTRRKPLGTMPRRHGRSHADILEQSHSSCIPVAAGTEPCGGIVWSDGFESFGDGLV